MNKSIIDYGIIKADIRFKLVIGETAIGPGKIRLLEKIVKFGSVSAAARDMDMNVRRAQYLIKTLNDVFNADVIKTTIGGRAGGNSALTALGQELINQYHLLNTAITKSTELQVKKIPEIILNSINQKGHRI